MWLSHSGCLFRRRWFPIESFHRSFVYPWWRVEVCGFFQVKGLMMRKYWLLFQWSSAYDQQHGFSRMLFFILLLLIMLMLLMLLITVNLLLHISPSLLCYHNAYINLTGFLLKVLQWEFMLFSSSGARKGEEDSSAKCVSIIMSCWGLA